MNERYMRGRGQSIEFFPGGVRLNGGESAVVEKSDRGALRGRIGGWSRGSRRRMREFLLKHGPVDGLDVYGVTLTVPGPNITREEKRKLLHRFGAHYLTRNGCGMVWRMEVQKRGAIHFHALVVAPPRVLSNVSSHPLPFEIAVRFWWLECLQVLGPVDHECKYKGREVTFTGVYRDQIPGAMFYAVDVQRDGRKGAWLRYLQDHATKAKQEQIAVDLGKHWGVVGKVYFQVQKPCARIQFTDERAFAKFLRQLHRLTRPVMTYRRRREVCRKYDSRPFSGRSLGWCSSRGRRGNSVWFSRTETMHRLAMWAEEQRAQELLQSVQDRP